MSASNFKSQFDGKTISIPETEMNCNFFLKNSLINQFHEKIDLKFQFYSIIIRET